MPRLAGARLGRLWEGVKDTVRELEVFPKQLRPTKTKRIKRMLPIIMMWQHCDNDLHLGYFNTVTFSILNHFRMRKTRDNFPCCVQWNPAQDA